MKHVAVWLEPVNTWGAPAVVTEALRCGYAVTITRTWRQNAGYELQAEWEVPKPDMCDGLQVR